MSGIPLVWAGDGNNVREMESGGQIRLARESYVLLAICLVDLLFTVWLVHTRRGIEGNPLMSFYLDSGWLTLVLVKLVLVVSPIFIAEWARRFRPVFVQRALRLAIAVYLGLYAIAFVSAGISAATDRFSTATEHTAPVTP